MAEGNVIRTITISGRAEGLDKLTAQLKELAAAEKGVAVVSEELTKSQLSLEAQMKRQNLRLDEVARRQNNIARETQLLDRGLKQGLITQDQYARRVELVNQHYATATVATQKFTQQTGLARHELVNLGRQAQDVAVSLAGGQGIGTVMLQQGSQIADVFISSGKSVGSFFSQAIGWGARFATSAAGVATGIGAIGAGALYAASSWADGQKEIDRALIGIGKRAGTTRGEINQMAEDNASAAKLSVSEWTTAASVFARTGNIAKDNFKGLGDLVKGFAVTTGESADDAAKQLAKIFSGDAMQAAEGLNAIFGNISGKTREYAQDLDVAGKRQQAFALLIREATSGIQQATQITGFWAASWDAVANAALNAGGSISKALAAMSGVGDTKEAKLGRAQGALTIAEVGLAQQMADAAQFGADLVPGLKQAEQAVIKLREEVAKLRAELGKVDESNALLKMGRDADDATKKLLPHIEQLRQIEKLRREINEGQTPGSGAALGGYSAEALRALDVHEMKVKSIAAETDRANQRALELTKTYGTQNVEVAKTLAAQKDQSAVTKSLAKLAAMKQRDNVVELDDHCQEFLTAKYRERRDERGDISAAA